MVAVILALAIATGIMFHLVIHWQIQADAERGLELARWRATEERLAELENEIKAGKRGFRETI